MATVNGGDGSAHSLFFSSRQRAERYMDEDPERFCDDISDISDGIEVDPVRYEWTDFAKAVGEHILPDPQGGAYREDRILDLAEHFECAQGTVHAWAKGSVIPHESLREQILARIARQAKEAGE
jgi:hypothetical protein